MDLPSYHPTILPSSGFAAGDGEAYLRDDLLRGRSSGEGCLRTEQARLVGQMGSVAYCFLASGVHSQSCWLLLHLPKRTPGISVCVEHDGNGRSC